MEEHTSITIKLQNEDYKEVNKILERISLKIIYHDCSGKDQ
jgi:hypothetical protein